MPGNTYQFWVRNHLDGPVTKETRVVMLQADGEHYKPVYCTYQGARGVETGGCCRLSEVPQEVLERWGTSLPIVQN